MKNYSKIIAIIGWFGVIGFLIEHLILTTYLSPIKETIHVLSYYTIQSNILVALWFTIISFKSKIRHDIEVGLVFIITPTLLLYWSMLHHVWQPKGFTLLLSIITHTIMPLSLWLHWLICKKQSYVTIKTAGSWLIYPLSYFVYSSVYQLVTNRVFYPFLNIKELGLFKLSRNVTMLILALSLFALIIRQINNQIIKNH